MGHQHQYHLPAEDYVGFNAMYTTMITKVIWAETIVMTMWIGQLMPWKYTERPLRKLVKRVLREIKEKGKKWARGQKVIWKCNLILRTEKETKLL